MDLLAATVLADKVKRAVILAHGAYCASYVPAETRHTLDETRAAELACRKLGLPVELGRLIGLALNGWPNDTLDWAGYGRE